MKDDKKELKNEFPTFKTEQTLVMNEDATLATFGFQPDTINVTKIIEDDK